MPQFHSKIMNAYLLDSGILQCSDHFHNCSLYRNMFSDMMIHKHHKSISLDNQSLQNRRIISNVDSVENYNKYRVTLTASVSFSPVNNNAQSWTFSEVSWHWTANAVIIFWPTNIFFTSFKVWWWVDNLYQEYGIKFKNTINKYKRTLN